MGSNPIDKFAQHEILHTIFLVGNMLNGELLDREDLPEPIRDILDKASIEIMDAYQVMGRLSMEEEGTQLDVLLDALEDGIAEFIEDKDGDQLLRSSLDIVAHFRLPEEGDSDG